MNEETKPRYWAVIAIDWQDPNVLSWWENKEDAEKVADRFDGLALRAAVVPEGDPRILDSGNPNALRRNR
jgi:hypothetical protein